MRKGIELPLNTMVVLAAAMIVLIVLIVLFMLVFPAPFGPFAMDSAKNEACLQVTSDCTNANPSNVGVSFDVKDKSGNDLENTLQNLCEVYKGCATGTDEERKECCKKVCGCVTITPYVPIPTPKSCTGTVGTCKDCPATGTCACPIGETLVTGVTPCGTGKICCK